MENLSSSYVYKIFEPSILKESYEEINKNSSGLDEITVREFELN